MNKIFKVIYSKTRHCYVVVSELAKNQGKSEKSKYGMKRHNRFYRLAAIAALIISTGSLLYPMQAEAALDLSVNDYFTAYDKDYFDQNGNRSDDRKKAYISNTNQDQNRVGAKNTGAIAAGMFAQAGQQTVTIGNRNAGASMGSVYVGEYKNYNTPTSTSVLDGLGDNYVTSVGFMSNATKYGTIAIGAGASAKGEDNSVTLGDKDPSGTLVSSLPDPDKLTIHGASVSLGYSAQSEHGNIAIGANSVATAAASTLSTAKFREASDGDYKAPSSYISVGSDTVKRRITNVAAGSDDNDVATVGQLSYVEQEAKAKGSWKLTAGGTNESTVEAGSTVDFSAGTDGNLSVTKTADSNNVTIGLNKDVILGKAAQGEGGSLSVYQDPSSTDKENGNDQMGSHVRIDGSTVSIRYQNGTKDSDARGVVLGVAKDSSNPLGYMYLADGKNYYYVHGTMANDPEALQGRLVYNSSLTGYNYIANLEDGISFSGDAVKAGSTTTNTTADTRLDPTAANHTLSIKGGVTDTTKLTSNNIGVVTTPTEYDGALNNGVTKAGGLTIQLAKDLTDITSITSQTTGSTTGAKVTLDTKDNNIDVNQGKVTNLSDGTVNATSTDAVTGKQLYNLDNSSVKYDTNGTTVNKTKITLAGGTTGTTITNVKAGTINVNSTDAVNGAQLYAEQQARAQDKTKYYSAHEGPQIADFSTNENNDGASAWAGLAAGYETGTAGIGSTVVGSYSGVMNTGTVPDGDLRGAASLSMGTLNLNQNNDTSKKYSGVANSIVGQGNVTTNSNAAIIIGAGNTITDSYRNVTIDTSTMKGSTPEKLEDALQTAVPNSGAQVMAIGGGNKITSAYKTQVVGVGNTVSDTELNYVDGFNNTVTNGKSNYIIGAKNTLDSGNNNVIFGDNHKLSSKSNNVIIGSADDENKELTASNAVVIGHNADVSVDGGVAIGSGSVSTATDEAYAEGYDPVSTAANKASTDDMSTTWKATTGAVSIGGVNGNTTTTRRITNLAAGFNDTDAVNVAQIKKLASINASNIGANLQYGADGTTAATDTDKTKNKEAWATAIGTGTVTKDDDGSKQMVTGKTVYDALHGELENITVGKDGKDGSIGIAGKDGKDGYTMTIIKTEQGAAGVDGKDGITRIVYQDKDDTTGKTKQTVATLDDGLKYVGDTGNAANVKLDHQLKLSGTTFDEKDENKKYKDTDWTSDNIAVVSSVADETTGDATMYLKLAKDLKNLNSSTYTTTEPTGEGDQQKTTTYTTVINGKGLTIQSGEQGSTTSTSGPSITIDGINAGGTAITNLKDGKLSNSSTDAVNGSQLYTEQKARTDADTKLTNDLSAETQAREAADTAINDRLGTLDANGNYIQKDASVSSNLNTLDTQVKANADAVSKEKQDREAAITNITNNIGDLSDSAVQYDKNSNKGTVTLAGADGTTIKNLKAGEVAETSKDAVNGSQLYAEQKARTDADTKLTNDLSAETQAREAADTAINDKLGTLDANGNYIQKDASVSSNLNTLDTQVKANADAISKEKQDREAAITNITNNIGNLSDSAVKYDANTNKTKITLAGKDGTTITNVKDGSVGKDSKDAVNGGQLFDEKTARENADTEIKTDITKIKNGEGFTDEGKTVIKSLAQDAVEVKGSDNVTVTNETKDGTKTFTVSVDNGQVASGDKGLISGDTLYNELRPSADGSYIKKDSTTAQNLVSLDTQVKKTSDLINSDGKTIKIGGSDAATKIDVNGKDGKGRVITGVVSDANDPNSAANVGYVNGLTAANTQQIYRDMNNAYSRLDTNINRAAAGSNALAALHPLDFDPADKASFAVGYGHYRNANAAAVGAFYQPNANTMVNMGISLGNGDPGFNAGVSFKIGKGSTYNGVSKAEMAQTIHDQATEISAIKADDAAKDKRIDALEKENQEMKKQIQEILARLNG